MTDWYKIKRVLTWVNWEEKQIYPKPPFTPTSDTLAYYKFDWNLNDSSSSGRNMSLQNWSVTYWTTAGWAKYWYFNTSTWTNNILFSSINYWTYKMTISYWIQPKTLFSDYVLSVELAATATVPIYARAYDSYTVTFHGNDTTYAMSKDTWYYVTITRDGTTCKYYVNWVLVGTQTWQTWTYDVDFKLNNAQNTSTTRYANDQYFSEMILENKVRSADEITAYYNATKSNYGL